MRIRGFVSVEKLSAITMAVIISLFGVFDIAAASPITNKKLTIGSSQAGADTSYTFNFTLPSATVLQSVSFTVCDAASGACNMPAGLSTTSATLASQPTNLGDASGWSVNSSTQGSLRIYKTGNVAAPTGNQTVAFNNVHNPSATNTSFYVRIATFSGDDWTGAVDSGVVASSTAGRVTVSVTIDEKLTFTLATTDVVLSQPNSTTTGFGTSSMSISTNASTGYSISYSGDTLMSGTDNIDPMSTRGPSAVDTEQFGLNLRNNATPDVGANVTGDGPGAPTANYTVVDEYMFNPSGDVVALSSSASKTNNYTVSYIVNADGATAAGSYSTILNYVAVANF